MKKMQKKMNRPDQEFKEQRITQNIAKHIDRDIVKF